MNRQPRNMKEYYIINKNENNENVYDWMDDTEWDSERNILYLKSTKDLLSGTVIGKTFKREYLNGKQNGLTINYDPHWGDFMKSEIRFKNGIQHGIQRFYWFNGLLSEEYFMNNGQKEGVYKKFNSNGRLEIERNFKKGKLEGREIEFTFYRNDALRITNWSNGKKHGKEYIWFEKSFKLKSETTYDNGKKNGVNREWFFSSEQLKFEKHYIQGKLKRSK